MGEVVLVVVPDDLVAQQRVLVEMEAARTSGDELKVIDVGRDNSDEVTALFGQTALFARRMRIVVRGLEAMDASAIEVVAEGLAEGVGDNRVVLFQRGGRVPKPLEALAGSMLTLERIGLTKDADRKSYFGAAVAESGLSFDEAALAALRAHLGEDVAGVHGILSVLLSAVPQDVLITPELLRPYLTQPGDIPLWNLTDAISSGDPSKAVTVLLRMQGSGRAPQLLISVVEKWFLELCALASPSVRTPEQARQALGASQDKVTASEFALKQRMRTARSLDYAKCARGVSLIAAGARALRGESGQPPEMVMEVLVARLTVLFRGARRQVPQGRHPVRSRAGS